MQIQISIYVLFYHLANVIIRKKNEYFLDLSIVRRISNEKHYYI